MQRPITGTNACFICGPTNPFGLQMKFQLQSGRCVSECTPARQFSGWEGFVHGGIIYSILDDAMANWLFLNGEKVLTARAEIRYRQPLPVETPIRTEGWEEKRRSRSVQLVSEMRRSDTDALIAEAKATFMLSISPDRTAMLKK